MTRPEVPFGAWASPITIDVVLSGAVSIGELAVGEDDLVWAELRPEEGGRTELVAHHPDGRRTDLLGDGFSARSRVHEYGGGAWWLHDDLVLFVNDADQRLHRLEPGGTPVPITPAPDHLRALRYADGCVTHDGEWTVCVRESHLPDREPRNEVVAVPLSGGEPVVLVSGPDFVAAPRVDPGGRRLCWLQWHHPDMPWDATELWVADLVRDGGQPSLRGQRLVAGGTGESVAEPRWSPDGVLYACSDRRGWWNLFRFVDDGAPEVVTELPADVAGPAWVFGQARYAVLGDGRVVLAARSDGVDRLAVVEPGSRQARVVASPFTDIFQIRAYGNGFALVAASFTSEPVVAVGDLPVGSDRATVALVRPSRDLGLDPRWWSVPEHVTVPVDGVETHALVYPPTNPEVSPPPDEAPPLLVLVHGGPTSAARPHLSLAVQYWTSRGFTVADVNYRGSTGYGRSYRQALEGGWGVIDVDDCVAVADALAGRGRVDPDRRAIRGGSAGGYTVLQALCRGSGFTAGTSLYGVVDLSALAADTHKFESRYLDRLVGPPDDVDRYRERSPLHHADRIRAPVLLLQGLEDAVVPPSQAEVLVEALRSNGVPFAYLAFEGEQHGFRRADTLRRALAAESSFYGRLFGFELAGGGESVPIENL